MMENRCIICGAEIPEGRQVCIACESSVSQLSEPEAKKYKDIEDFCIESNRTSTGDVDVDKFYMTLDWMRRVNQKSIFDYTKDEFLALEARVSSRSRIDFNEIIIVPTSNLHESGFRCMRYVLVRDTLIIGVVDCGSDVLHLFDIIKMESTRKWNVDCLATSGCIRLFTHNSRNLKLEGYASDCWLREGLKNE